MSDSEFSSFEEYGEYKLYNEEGEGLSETFSDISIESDSDSSENESDEDTPMPQHVFTEVLTPIQLEPFTQPIGATHNLDYQTAKELDYFSLLFSEEMLAHMVTQTNLYAVQLAPWTDFSTNKEELRAYIGINMLMGIVVEPELSLYWSGNKYFGIQGVKDVMTRERFKTLNSHFHVNDNTTAVPRGEIGYNPLDKIQPLLTSVRQQNLEQYNPGQNLAIYEAMVGFKDRTFMKQHPPGKPTKWGFKIWTLADSATGYVCDMDVYSGKRNAPSENGIGYDVVMGLAQPFLNRYHHIYFDNFFSSLKLATDLLDAKTYSCATIKANRVGLPDVVKKPGKMTRGASIKRKCGNMVATVWHDKRNVRMLSTNSPATDGVVQRRVGGSIQDMPCPNVIINYNRHMGGVDLSDQNRSYYDVGRQAKTYWKKLVWYLINLCIVNSYVVYQQTMISAQQTPKKHLAYRQCLIEQLIGGYTSRRRSGRCYGYPSVELSQFPGHDLVKAAKRLSCKNCTQLKRKTAAGRYIQTSFQCRTCHVHLCQDGCLIEFHTRHATK